MMGFLKHDNCVQHSLLDSCLKDRERLRDEVDRLEKENKELKREKMAAENEKRLADYLESEMFSISAPFVIGDKKHYSVCLSVPYLLHAGAFKYSIGDDLSMGKLAFQVITVDFFETREECAEWIEKQPRDLESLVSYNRAATE